MSIELEPLDYLKAWLEEFNTTDRLTLPGVPYSYPAIVREILRRDSLDGVMEDWK